MLRSHRSFWSLAEAPSCIWHNLETDGADAELDLDGPCCSQFCIYAALLVRHDWFNAALASLAVRHRTVGDLGLISGWSMACALSLSHTHEP